MSTTYLSPPIVDDATRRQFLALLGATGLLTACASPDADPAAEPPARTRTVEHTAGTTEVPVQPQRVVTLDSTIAMGLIALGLAPTGAPEDVDGFLTDLADALPDEFDPDALSPVYGDDGPQLEAIATLGPDLVVGTEFEQEFYDRLTAVAPTVLVEYGENGGWRARFLVVADAVNRGEQAAEIEAAYEQLLADLPDAVRSTTVAFIRPQDDGQFRIDSGPSGFAGSVAVDAAIPALEAPGRIGETDEGSGFVTVSGERLDVIAPAGLIVVPDYRSLGDEQDGISLFATNPLWETLPAVTAGRVLQVPGLVYNGGNHYAAELLLRAITEALT